MTPFHNKHINHFSDKSQALRINVLSEVYWFNNMKEPLVLDIKRDIDQDIKQDKNQVMKWNIDKDINQGIKQEIAMVGIEKPARVVTKGLFSTWRMLSELHPLTDLWMREVRSQELTEQEVPVLSRNVSSLWIIDSELPVAFWRNILHQLIGCPTLQFLWLQETNVNEVEEGLDKLLENIMNLKKKELTLFIQNKLSEQFKKKWRDLCTKTNIKCDIK